LLFNKIVSFLQKTPTLQGQNSDENSCERKCSAQNEAPAEKQHNVEASKSSVPIEPLGKDRPQRICPDFSEEISSLVIDLVEEVGTNIDLENLKRKIQEEVWMNRVSVKSVQLIFLQF
jgi:hypothetical protein